MAGIYKKAWFLITLITVVTVVVVALVFTGKVMRTIAGRMALGEDKTTIGDRW